MLIFQKRVSFYLENLFTWIHDHSSSSKLSHIWKIGSHSIWMWWHHQNMDQTSHQLCKAWHIIRTIYNNALLTKIAFFLFMTLCQSVIDISRQCSVLTFMSQNVLECFPILEKEFWTSFDFYTWLFIVDVKTTFHGTDMMSNASEQSTYID